MYRWIFHKFYFNITIFFYVLFLLCEMYHYIAIIVLSLSSLSIQMLFCQITIHSFIHRCILPIVEAEDRRKIKVEIKPVGANGTTTSDNSDLLLKSAVEGLRLSPTSIVSSVRIYVHYLYTYVCTSYTCYVVARGSSAVECRTLTRESAWFKSPLLLSRCLGIFVLTMIPQLYKCLPG